MCTDIWGSTGFESFWAFSGFGEHGESRVIKLKRYTCRRSTFLGLGLLKSSVLAFTLIPKIASKHRLQF